eukprot:gnl/Trimastix_PCT/165.p1 GENE.gnl/Trimastix_PCT/165~~gnl/Trimastix_PCT/165.p1  ORF type:complete len:387 (+),score=102.75 gnl/Trimastix_PCT/165:51-1211(+)
MLAGCREEFSSFLILGVSQAPLWYSWMNMWSAKTLPKGRWLASPMGPVRCSSGICSTTMSMFNRCVSSSHVVLGTAKIKKLENFSLHPASIVLHYAQEIFEGLKCFKRDDGKLSIFRPEQNIKRFNRSAERMCMPQVDEDVFMRGMKQLCKIEERHVPAQKGTALYLRPFMIGTESVLGVRSSADYIFCIICSPVGPYYPQGFSTGRYYVTRQYTRAAPGGTGDAKCGGNYASSLYAGKIAKEKGCSQVLWLDATHHNFVEEVGAMNMFFVLKGVVYTAPLRGTILPGITRASVIQLLRDLGFTVEERALGMDEIQAGCANGELSEAFGSGTAAAISPVGELLFEEELLTINNNEVGPVTRRLYDALQGIYYGTHPDTHTWCTLIE